MALSYITPRRTVARDVSEVKASSNAGDLLDALYATAVEFSRLPEALTLLARAFDADEAYFFAADPSVAGDKVTIVERSRGRAANDAAVAEQLFARAQLAIHF